MYFLLQEFLPDLHQHFQTQSFHTSMYASSWFLTLFATVVPLSVACRVMDLFISEVSDSLNHACRDMRKRVLGVPTRFNTNRAVRSQKMERFLEFWINEVEGLYYLCSENEGADQLCVYRTADLRLRFRI